MLQIPLVQGINNTVETTINNQSYTFITNWNDRFEYYSMDILIESVEVASGIVLVSGVDVATISAIELNRVYCINKNESTEDFGFTGLGDDGLVIIIEDSDLEE
jgi:hypothetical protein